MYFFLSIARIDIFNLRSKINILDNKGTLIHYFVLGLLISLWMVSRKYIISSSNLKTCFSESQLKHIYGERNYKHSILSRNDNYFYRFNKIL